MMMRAIVVCLAMLVVAVAATQTQIPAEQDRALRALYDNCNGKNWAFQENWLNDYPCESKYGGRGWYGVFCWCTDNCDSPGNRKFSVYGFRMESNNMTCDMSELSVLLGLPDLEMIAVAGERLSGALSDQQWLTNFTNLQCLDVAHNHLTGSVPDFLADVKHLELLDLTGMHLVGEIPPALGSLTQLQQLFLDYNNFTGGIPTELSKLAKLEVLAVTHNQLTGTIPAELGKLKALYILSVNDNLFTGSIPASLGTLPRVYQIWMANNQLSGSLPAALGALSHLVTLSVENNHLSGCVPAEYAGLTGLSHIDVSGNKLSGSWDPALQSALQSIPDSIGACVLSGNPGLACLPTNWKTVCVQQGCDSSLPPIGHCVHHVSARHTPATRQHQKWQRSQQEHLAAAKKQLMHKLKARHSH